MKQHRVDPFSGTKGKKACVMSTSCDHMQMGFVYGKIPTILF